MVCRATPSYEDKPQTTLYTIPCFAAPRKSSHKKSFLFEKTDSSAVNLFRLLVVDKTQKVQNIGIKLKLIVDHIARYPYHCHRIRWITINVLLEKERKFSANKLLDSEKQPDHGRSLGMVVLYPVSTHSESKPDV